MRNDTHSNKRANDRHIPPIVHIGLGKTATTTLQRNVFPYVPTIRPEIVYNDSYLIQEINRLQRRVATTLEEKNFFERVRAGNNFISREGLVDWNPRNWESAADRNIRLFGDDATILITIRETEDYLRSVYQQKVHEGNIRNAEDFFLNESEYDPISDCLAPAILSRFDVDSFNLERLYKIYTERFKRVIMVPLITINRLEFLRAIFNLDDIDMKFLRGKMSAGRNHNRAYSKRAMALTLKRERLLNILGLMTVGSDYSLLTRVQKGSERESVKAPFRSLSQSDKTRELPIRALKRLIKILFRCLKWRYFLQNIFDRVVPYKPYKLPSNAYRNAKLAEENDRFMQRFIE